MGEVARRLLLATAERQKLARLATTRLATTRLAELADDALRRWQPTPRHWLRGDRGDETVLADPDRLAAALDAVLHNAVRFTATRTRSRCQCAARATRPR